jgi:universal stress protein A
MKVKPAKESGGVVMELGRADDEILASSPIHIRNILVPVDFSDCSKKALQYALPIARQFGAKITLLHVVQLNYLLGTEFATIDFSRVEKDMRTQAEAELARMAGVDETIPCTPLVRVGQPVEEIAQTARKQKTDIIILSTHGRTGLRHMLLGSVAENVVRHAPCPVLIVREQERDFVGTPAE